MGIPHGNANSTEPLLLSPLGESCLRMDLTAIHEILEKIGYKDDEGIANEVRYQQNLIFFKILYIISVYKALCVTFIFVNWDDKYWLLKRASIDSISVKG